MAEELPEAVAERQRNYHERRKERGEVRVTSWVPAECAQAVRDFATKLRREAEIRDGETRTPAVQFPKIEIPEYPPPGHAWIRIEEEELALRKLIKQNGGEWNREKQAWWLRSDLVEPMGLQSRVISNEMQRQTDLEHYLQERRPPLATTAPEKIGRNQPCPCGSGKKYKRCCGKA